MALIATVGLGVMSVVFLQRSKTETKIGKRLGADNDIEIAVSTLAATLASPLHCSATFKGLSSSPGLQNLSDIKQCTSGTCGSTVNAVSFMGLESGSSWRLDRVNTNAKPPNARIRNLRFEIYKPQQTKQDADANSGAMAPYVGVMPAIVRIYITFDKNLGATNTGNIQFSNGADITAATIADAKFKVYTIEAMVVTNTYNFTTHTLVPNGANNIVGCPRSAGSTTVY